MSFKNTLRISGAVLGLFAATAAFAQDTTCTAGCGDIEDATINVRVIDATAVFAGFGNARFVGEEGYAITEKEGSAGVNITGDVSGGLCSNNPDCTSGEFRATGFAREEVMAAAGASTTTSGQDASVMNNGGAYGALQFNFGSLRVTQPATTTSGQ